MQNQDICLNMIVKNESHIIEKTLNNLCSYFDFLYWVICDTGSTDNTIDIIINFFKEKNIKGELIQNDWVDFGYNRTFALQKAYNKSDYLLIFDADDYINGNLEIKEKLNFNVYNLKIGKDFCYKRPLLINNRLKWEFKGVLHEFLSEKKDEKKDENTISHFISQTTIEGDYYISSGRCGDRSKDKDKYLKDAKILENAYNNETDVNMKNRYAFYCAQSYKDSNLNNESIFWYKKVLDSNNWNQEKYYACMMIAEQYKQIGITDEMIKYYSKASTYDIERIENIVRLTEYYYNQGNHLFVNMLYEKFKNYTKEPSLDKLFIDMNSYENDLEYYNSISAYYINNLKSGYESCKRIINSKQKFIDTEKNLRYINTTINNLLFYTEMIEKDEDYDDCIENLFMNLNEKIKLLLDDRNTSFNIQNIEKLWNIIYSKIEKSDFLKTERKIIKNRLVGKMNERRRNKENVNILLTMTTCKRYDLFEKTINSILSTWKDIDKVDYWFCVDDNSSDSDKCKMLSEYPFFYFYFKNRFEKGHMNSMNIIYNRLVELKPKYWIHIEDDFIFYDRDYYISKSIKGLELLNVNQILFNRNYGETIKDYMISGHIKVDDEFCLHDYKPNESLPYSNCKYWPHYSFRPSLIDTEAILSLGDFNTNEDFFELAYAKKWTDRGYKSGFFNKMTCMHIGRLTSERNNKEILNAYNLNNVNQFTNTDSKFIKIINLERRIDRKESSIIKLCIGNITNYEFIKAFDSREITNKTDNLHLFKGNDFNNRKGFIGCALSHYNLWLRLLNDENHLFYLVMEDDFVLCKGFKKELSKIFQEMTIKTILFLGYHMFEKNRNEYRNIYDSEFNQDYKLNGNISIEKLNRNLYIGSTCCYSINKKGARMMIDYIHSNGIKHGIDYLFKIAPELECYETRPHLSFSDWNENNKQIDTDIQMDYTNLNSLD
jgi:GR25 family glycosyltransferase involved in LPS biosynthesis